MLIWEENIFTKYLHVKSQILQTITADEGNILIDGYCTPSLTHSQPLRAILIHLHAFSRSLIHSHPLSLTPRSSTLIHTHPTPPTLPTSTHFYPLPPTPTYSDPLWQTLIYFILKEANNHPLLTTTTFLCQNKRTFTLLSHFYQLFTKISKCLPILIYSHSFFTKISSHSRILIHHYTILTKTNPHLPISSHFEVYFTTVSPLHPFPLTLTHFPLTSGFIQSLQPIPTLFLKPILVYTPPPLFH